MTINDGALSRVQEYEYYERASFRIFACLKIACKVREALRILLGHGWHASWVYVEAPFFIKLFKPYKIQIRLENSDILAILK